MLKKGILEKQKCGGTWMTMNSPYNDLSIAKHELVRNPQELLLAGYNDYQRLHQLEDEIRALYPVYITKLSKLLRKIQIGGDIASLEHTYGKKLLGDMVLVKTNKLAV